MKKVFLSIVIILYLIVCMVVTKCLLTYNDYMISEISDKTLIIIDEDTKILDYKKGSLLVVTKDLKVKPEEKVIYYNTADDKVNIEVGTVELKEKVTENEYTFLIDDNFVSSKFIIGAVDDIKEYKVIGSILGILESKWGYLTIVILPILLMFVCEVHQLIGELKPKKKGKKNAKKK